LKEFSSSPSFSSYSWLCSLLFSFDFDFFSFFAFPFLLYFTWKTFFRSTSFLSSCSSSWAMGSLWGEVSGSCRMELPSTSMKGR
jgi:hypothetical protein